MVFHLSLSDSKSQVSRTLLDLNKAVFWMVSTRPLISKSSSLCTNPLLTLPSTPTIIDSTVIFIFYSFLSSLARSRYYLSFRFPLVLPCKRQSLLFGWFSSQCSVYFFFIYFLRDTCLFYFCLIWWNSLSISTKNILSFYMTFLLCHHYFPSLNYYVPTHPLLN